MSTLLAQLKVAIGDNTTGNAARNAELRSLLSLEQQCYASTYDFPFLEHRWDLSCTAGTRFFALPTAVSTVSEPNALTAAINFDRQVRVDVKFNTVWLPLTYGISDDEFTVFDSDNNVRSYPIQRWRMASNTSDATNANYIEVWPIPDQTQTVRFSGQRQLLAFAADADKADLDDMLLVYSVAVKKAVRADLLEEAKAMLAMARRRELNVKAQYPMREDCLVMGQGSIYRREERKLIPMRIVA